MKSWIATALLALASKVVIAAPSSPGYIPEPQPVYVDCEWIARVCWCVNIHGYRNMVSDEWCFFEQDDEDWDANYVPKEEVHYSDSEEEYADSEGEYSETAESYTELERVYSEEEEEEEEAEDQD
ncbi:hypothetical protein HOO65_100021 [Ceratocystis lukuohia]|uniref:Uncharacterized protein n=1 Tax=Ceratocystis lukuohia TaxID=2019550 RepID=A0ABR4M8M2_9PEZI